MSKVNIRISDLMDLVRAKLSDAEIAVSDRLFGNYKQELRTGAWSGVVRTEQALREYVYNTLLSELTEDKLRHSVAVGEMRVRLSQEALRADKASLEILLHLKGEYDDNF